MEEDLFQFSIAGGIQDLAEAHALRLLRYEPRFPESDYWWLDRERDLQGKVFLLRKNDRSVATLRIIPVTSCTTEIEEMGHLPAELAKDPEVWELGRLTALPSRGQDFPYSRLLFGWASQWALDNLPIRKVVSYCRGGVLSGFLACGAEIVDGPYDIPGRGRDYYTIVADVAVVVERMRAYGFEALLSAAHRGQMEFQSREMTDSVAAPAVSGTVGQ